MSFNPFPIILAVLFFLFALAFAAIILRAAIWLVRTIFGVDRQTPVTGNADVADESWQSEGSSPAAPALDATAPISNPYSVGKSVPMAQPASSSSSPLPMPSFRRTMGIIFVGLLVNYLTDRIVVIIPRPANMSGLLLMGSLLAIFQSATFVTLIRYLVPTSFLWAFAVFVTAVVISVALGMGVGLTFALFS